MFVRNIYIHVREVALEILLGSDFFILPIEMRFDNKNLLAALASLCTAFMPTRT